MNGIIQNTTSFVRADYDKLPKCMLFDCMQCLFSNGDEINIVGDDSGMPYENGYILELRWFETKSELDWNCTVFVQQGSIQPVYYYETDITDDECIYISDLAIDNSKPYVATTLYPSATEDWKNFLVACMMYC